VGSRGKALAGGLGDGVPQKLKHFCKYKPSNLRPRENYFNNNNNNRLSLTFVFSPWDLYSLGHKNNNNIMIIIFTLGTYIHKDLTDGLD